MRNIGVVHGEGLADLILGRLQKEFPKASFSKGTPDSGAPGRVSIQMRTDTADMTEPVVEQIGRRFNDLKMERRGEALPEAEPAQKIEQAPKLEGERPQNEGERQLLEE